MTPNVYEVDTFIQINSAFTACDGSAPLDPSTVILWVCDPTGTITQVTTPDLVHIAVGVYAYQMVLNQIGVWTYKWQGLGTVEVTSPDATMIVNRTVFAPPLPGQPPPTPVWVPANFFLASTTRVSGAGVRQPAPANFAISLATKVAGRAPFTPPASTTLLNVATDASTTPSTVSIVLGPGQNAVRVFSGSPAVTEPFFYLYVARNGQVSKVKLYRWQGRIVTGAPGDFFAFGTADGRTLTMAAMTVPTSLVNASGATGVANCDKAGPPLWSPSAPHVTLPALGSTFTISADGTERIVFIAELSPSGAWTPLRWVRHSATRDTHIRCNFQQVALANYGGAPLNVVAPTGGTVGGTSASMTLPIPAVTGTSHLAVDLPSLKTAMATAIAGDEIVVAAGAYPFDIPVTQANFTANQARGNVGAEGILIRGATGVAADVVLTTDGNGQNGGWTMTQPGGGRVATGYATFKDLTFDFASTPDCTFLFLGGLYYFQNVRGRGGALGTTSNAMIHGSYGQQAHSGVTLKMLFCDLQNGPADLYSLSGDNGTNANSLVQITACSGSNAGSANNAQILTTHFGLPVEAYGCTFSNAFLNVIANGAATCYVFFTTTFPGARAAGVQDSILFGCNLTWGASVFPNPARFTRFTGTGMTTGAAMVSTGGLPGAAQVEHNIISPATGRGDYITLGGSTLVGNVILNANDGLYMGNASAAQPTPSQVWFNTAASNVNGFSFLDLNQSATFYGNAAKTNTASINVSPAGVGALVTGDYNTADDTISANYVPGAHDTLHVDAALDADFFPVAAGNCDSNGPPALIDWIGDSDPWGFVMIYKAGVTPRGARSIPAIISGAQLHPDIF